MKFASKDIEDNRVKCRIMFIHYTAASHIEGAPLERGGRVSRESDVSKAITGLTIHKILLLGRRQSSLTKLFR